MHANSFARSSRLLAVTVLAIFSVSGCGEGDGQASIAGTPAPASSGVLVDSPVSGVSWESSSDLSGTTDDQGTFQYLWFDDVTFSIGGIVLGTVPGAPVISPVELTGSNNPTDQAALNMLVFLQSIDADSDPSNGIQVSDAARVNAAGIAFDFHSADFATQIAAVVAIIVPGNTVVSENDALNHFYNTYAALGGTDTFSWEFPGYPPVGGGASYELVFADEFNEGTAPDPAKWTYETGYGSNGWGNNEWQLYTESPDNVRVEDGNLVISALCPTAPCGIRDGSITSGKVNTLGKFNFRYGKIVARIKPPVGKAAWPAFWSLGTNFPDIGWPRSGEIDFMELHNFYSDENTTHFTMHWWDEVADSWVYDSQYLTTDESLGDDFHLFEADWNEDRIIGKIDGQTYFTRQIEPGTMEEFLEEFYLILNVAMGGTLGSGNEPPAGDETFPQTMLVDYVRVFQGTDGSGGGAGGVLANFDDVIPSTITEFDGAGYAIEAGPVGGDNNALRITRDGGEVYAGVFISVSGIPSNAGEQTISALVYSPTAGIPFVTKLEYDQGAGTVDVQANETVVEGWQTLTWTYSLEAGNDYNRFVILPDLGMVGAGEVYYIDNITLVGSDGGDGGTGGGDAPTVAAPTPPVRDAADVISLFSDAYTDVTVDTWRTDWSIATLADVDIAGNATKEYTNLNFVGIETVAEQVDATGMTHFHVDIWTPNAETLEIKLVDFGPNGAFEGNLVLDDTEGSIFYDGNSRPVPAQGEWLSLDIPLADFEAAGLVNRANIAQLIFAATPSDNVTLYVDNVYFYNGAGGGTGGGDTPTVAAPTPTVAAANVISLFSDAYTDVTVDTWRTDWSSATLTDVTIDGNAVKQYTDLDFVGIETVSSPLDMAGATHFHVDVWTPNAEQLRIKLVDFGADGTFDGGDDTEAELVFDGTTTPALTQGEWVSLDIPLADFQAAGLVNRSNIAQIIFSASPPGSTTLFVTNVYFYDAGGSTPSEPTTAAPTPTVDAGSVTSVFSDVYTDPAGVDYNPNWGQATVTTVESIAGGEVLKLAGLNYQGIDFITAGTALDVSAHDTLHIDFWTPDATAVNVFLISSGPAETAYALPIVTGSWQSVEIPLSAFSGVDLADVIQMKFDDATTGEAATIFFDNIYFYTATGADAPTTAAPTPTVDAGSVTSVFSDAYTDPAGVDYNPNWGQATVTTVESIAGGEVLQLAGLNYQGIDFITAGTALDVSAHDTLHIDFWTPDATAVNVFLISSGPAETPYALPIVTGSWQSVEIPLSAFSGVVDLADVIQMKFDDATTGEAATIFFDNIYFYTATIPDAPTTAAPTPTVDAGSVTSVFSDAYTDPVGVDYNPNWGQATVTTVESIAGGEVLQLAGLNYQGIDFATGGSALDVSAHDTLHIDFWTPDATAVNVFLISSGPAETPYALPIVNGSWQSVEIPLSTFSGVVNLADVIQMKFDDATTGEAATIFFDNIYFYTSGGTGGGGTFVNGDFENGFTGWTQELIPSDRGSIALDSSGQGGRTGTVARLVAAGDASGTNDVLISQVALAAGTVSPGDSIDVSFDLYGALTGAGGVVFVEVIFLNGAGEDVGGRDFVGPAFPYTPTATWTTHSGTVIAGTGVRRYYWI